MEESDNAGEFQNIFLNDDQKITQLQKDKSELEKDLKRLKISRLLAESNYKNSETKTKELINEIRFENLQFLEKFLHH